MLGFEAGELLGIVPAIVPVLLARLRRCSRKRDLFLVARPLLGGWCLLGGRYSQASSNSTAASKIKRIFMFAILPLHRHLFHNSAHPPGSCAIESYATDQARYSQRCPQEKLPALAPDSTSQKQKHQRQASHHHGRYASLRGRHGQLLMQSLMFSQSVSHPVYRTGALAAYACSERHRSHSQRDCSQLPPVSPILQHLLKRRARSYARAHFGKFFRQRPRQSRRAFNGLQGGLRQRRS